MKRRNCLKRLSSSTRFRLSYKKRPYRASASELPIYRRKSFARKHWKSSLLSKQVIQIQQSWWTTWKQRNQGKTQISKTWMNMSRMLMLLHELKTDLQIRNRQTSESPTRKLSHNREPRTKKRMIKAQLSEQDGLSRVAINLVAAEDMTQMRKEIKVSHNSKKRYSTHKAMSEIGRTYLHRAKRRSKRCYKSRDNLLEASRHIMLK